MRTFRTLWSAIRNSSICNVLGCSVSPISPIYAVVEYRNLNIIILDSSFPSSLQFLPTSLFYREVIQSSACQCSSHAAICVFHSGRFVFSVCSQVFSHTVTYEFTVATHEAGQGEKKHRGWCWRETRLFIKKMQLGFCLWGGFLIEWSGDTEMVWVGFKLGELKILFFQT